MKYLLKRLAAALAALILLLSASSALAITMRIGSIGNAEEIFPAVAFYCNSWQKLFGESTGVDLSFDPEHVTVIAEKHINLNGNMVTSFDYDGIIADVEDDHLIYEIQIPMHFGEAEQDASVARLFALVNALGFDEPASDEEMTGRYTSLLEDYKLFLNENRYVLAVGDFAYWKVKTDKRELEFFFSADEDSRIWALLYGLNYGD